MVSCARHAQGFDRSGSRTGCRAVLAAHEDDPDGRGHVRGNRGGFRSHRMITVVTTVEMLRSNTSVTVACTSCAVCCPWSAYAHSVSLVALLVVQVVCRHGRCAVGASVLWCHAVPVTPCSCSLKFERSALQLLNTCSRYSQRNANVRIPRLLEGSSQNVPGASRCCIVLSCLVLSFPILHLPGCGASVQSLTPRLRLLRASNFRFGSWQHRT